MIRLALLDVEGVLALPGGSQYPWPLEDLLAVRRLVERAPFACVLCTGRQEPYGEAVIQALNLFHPLPDDVRERVRARSGHDLLAWPSLMENGAYFYDPLAKRPIPHPALTPEVIQAIQRMRAAVLSPLAADTGALVEAGKDFTISLNPPQRGPSRPERIPPAEFRPLLEAALAAYAEVVEIKHSHSALDVTPRGVSKASAVRLLLEWTGLAPEEILGVGDSVADAEWLREVGWRAAPANGREALPGLDFYAEAEVTRGLVEILDRLLANGCRGL